MKLLDRILKTWNWDVKNSYFLWKIFAFGFVSCLINNSESELSIRRRTALLLYWLLITPRENNHFALVRKIVIAVRITTHLSAFLLLVAVNLSSDHALYCQQNDAYLFDPHSCMQFHMQLFKDLDSRLKVHAMQEPTKNMYVCILYIPASINTGSGSILQWNL